MEFAMASKLLRKKEKLPRFGSKHARAEKTLSILAEIISHPALSIFMCTVQLAATRWKRPRRRFESSAISMRQAAPLCFCLPQQRHRWINSLRFWMRFAIVDLLMTRLRAFTWRVRLFQRRNVERNARN